ncbi:MAG TPA: BatD family protein, partial [Pseudomonadota bacterium]|nr:BatD family protein [Pseudomonadota bacterium]
MQRAKLQLRCGLLFLLGVVGLVGAPGRAAAQQLTLHLDADEVYANLPFVLSVAAQGFDETPQPTLSPLTIANCRVTPLGVTPNVSSMLQIINGQRTESRSVTFVYRFRVEAAKPGQYVVPALTAQQGATKAQSQPARFTVRAVDDSKDMQLRLSLPDRPLWVGETVEGSLDWYLRRDVGNRTFAVPLFDLDDWLEIEAPAGDPKLAGFHAGSRQFELPYKQDKAALDGTDYTRFRFQFRLTPSKAGVLSPPPARVVAELRTGIGRDPFGFQVPESALFQAVSKPLRLEIRPLPQAGRPAGFKNAVGSSFALEVQAGRTVVRLGDPIELRILLRGNGRLAGLILPELSAMGLSEQYFGAPEEPPAGELLEDGKGKLFRVTVRLRSTEAREIPALSLGYFDPDKGSFQIVHSQPIALSVKGSAVVGAGDVVGSAP